MGIANKVRLMLRAKALMALDWMADPRETLNYSHQRQVELLTKVQRAVADSVASRARIKVQMSTLRCEQAELVARLRRPDDAAEEREEPQALRRKAEVDSKLASLAAQYDSLRSEEESLSAARYRLEAKVEVFRVRRENIKAADAAAEAQNRIVEIGSSISKEIDRAGMEAISRPRQRQMLTQLRSSMKGAATCRERLDQQIDTLRRLQADLDDQASRQLDNGREDLARQASTRKAAIDSQLSDLAAQRDSLQADVERFTTVYEQLAAKAEPGSPERP